jgi:acetyltransferase-like isoleucine patch superfamily enzyme
MSDDTASKFRLAEAGAFFDARTDIRAQILNYEAARTMSDVERARFFGLPEGCRMREGAKIISPEKLLIGANCWIGENAILDASGGLEIGEHTSIGLSVFVWTHDSHKMNIRGENQRENNHRIKRRPTKIGSRVFLAGPSVIMPGVTVGDGCVIAPMSLVNEDLPDGTVYKPYANLLRDVQDIKTHLGL